VAKKTKTRNHTRQRSNPFLTESPAFNSHLGKRDFRGSSKKKRRLFTGVNSVERKKNLVAGKIDNTITKKRMTVKERGKAPVGTSSEKSP